MAGGRTALVARTRGHHPARSARAGAQGRAGARLAGARPPSAEAGALERGSPPRGHAGAGGARSLQRGAAPVSDRDRGPAQRAGDCPGARDRAPAGRPPRPSRDPVTLGSRCPAPRPRQPRPTRPPHTRTTRGPGRARGGGRGRSRDCCKAAGPAGGDTWSSSAAKRAWARPPSWASCWNGRAPPGSPPTWFRSTTMAPAEMPTSCRGCCMRWTRPHTRRRRTDWRWTNCWATRSTRPRPRWLMRWIPRRAPRPTPARSRRWSPRPAPDTPASSPSRTFIGVMPRPRGSCARWRQRRRSTA